MNNRPTQPPPPSSRRRVKIAALVLVVMMAVAGVGLLRVGNRAVELDQRVDTLSSREKELTNEIARLAEERKTLESDLAELEERRVQLQAEISVLNTTLGYVRKANPQATAVAESRAELISRVYIQVGSDTSVRRGEALATRLREAGFVVPRIERVRAVPRQPQVRYFSANDKAHAERVLALVKGELPGASIVLFTPADTPTKMRSSHIELWF